MKLKISFSSHIYTYSIHLTSHFALYFYLSVHFKRIVIFPPAKNRPHNYIILIQQVIIDHER